MILKAFLLMTFFLAAGFLTINYAQPSTASLTGEWVGNSEPSGRSEFLRLSLTEGLTENAGEMLRPLRAKVTIYHLRFTYLKLHRFSSLIALPQKSISVTHPFAVAIFAQVAMFDPRQHNCHYA